MKLSHLLVAAVVGCLLSVDVASSADKSRVLFLTQSNGFTHGPVNRAGKDGVKKELASGLYKIWPKEKLEPGEYAVVEYTENKLNIQVWDFAIQAK